MSAPTCTNHESPFARYATHVDARCQSRDDPNAYRHQYDWCRYDGPLPILLCGVPGCDNQEFGGPLCEMHIGVLIDFEEMREATA